MRTVEIVEGICGLGIERGRRLIIGDRSQVEKETRRKPVESFTRIGGSTNGSTLTPIPDPIPHKAQYLHKMAEVRSKRPRGRFESLTMDNF